MKIEIIPVNKKKLKIKPNLKNYEAVYKKFKWKDAENELAWFPKKKINAAYNAIEKHLSTWRKNKVALYWEGADSSKKEYSFLEISEFSNKFANVLKKYGIKKGDRCFIFLPRIPELYISFLGILKTGAIAGTMFSAFGPQGIRDRLQDSEAKFLITDSELLKRVYEAAPELPDLKYVFILNNSKQNKKNNRKKEERVKFKEINYEEEMQKASKHFKIVHMKPEDEAFMLYTSGCCHPDALIQLANGEVRKIKELVENNEKSKVLNMHPNPFKQTLDDITHLHKYNYSDYLYQIKTASCDGIFTSNHSFFVLNEKGEICEKEVKALTKKDYVFIASKIKINGSKQKLPKLELSFKFRNKTQFKPKNIPDIPRFLTPQFSQILGYLIGDGHIDRRSIIFTDKDEKNLKYYKNMIKNELNLPSQIREKSNRERLLVNSVLFRNYIEKNFRELVVKSTKRKIPLIIQRSDNKTLAGFLRGLFDAEGCVGELFIKMSTTSKEMARLIQFLLKRFSILSNIYTEINKGGRFGNRKIKETLVYNVQISERVSLKNFLKEIDFSAPSKQIKFNKLIKKLNEKNIIEKERFPLANLLKKLHSLLPFSGKEMSRMTGYFYCNHLIGRDKLKQLLSIIKKKRFLDKEKRKEIQEICQKIEKILEINGAILERVNEVKIVKDHIPYVYDLTTKFNHNYIVDGFITHNTTGKPKGVVHSHIAILTEHMTAKWVLDIKPEDIYWCTADPGWVTGVAYELLGSWSNGVSQVVYEGRFDAAKWYEIIERYKVTVWYTAPTAIRLLAAADEIYKKYDLSSLRHLCSVGEPLNPQPIKFGMKAYKLPFHDNWWQTETGGILIANYPCMPIKLGSMGKPVPGIKARIVDDKGNKLPTGKIGNLAIKPGWPSMMLKIWKNRKKYNSYFVKGWYITGDLAYLDKQNYFWFVGRADDVIKTSGERVGPFEVESALVEHPAVVEAGVIGKPDPEGIRGEIIKAFIVLKQGFKPSKKLEDELKEHVKKKLAGHAYPREFEFIEKLPKTRSGKIMRRLLKAKELGLPIGDTSTLEEY